FRQRPDRHRHSRHQPHHRKRQPLFHQPTSRRPHRRRHYHHQEHALRRHRPLVLRRPVPEHRRPFSRRNDGRHRHIFPRLPLLIPRDRPHFRSLTGLRHQRGRHHRLERDRFFHRAP